MNAEYIETKLRLIEHELELLRMHKIIDRLKMSVFCLAIVATGLFCQSIFNKLIY